MAWQPVVSDDALAARCRAAVADIVAAAVDAPSPGWDLAGGDAGLAILFAYLARAEPARYGALADAARARIDAAYDRLAQVPARPGLWQGAAGVAWAGDHVRAL